MALTLIQSDTTIVLMNRIAKHTIALGAVACLGLSACGSTDSSNSSSSKVEIAASFYPVMWLAQQIGGDAVNVTSVTPTNVEPHDYELSPKDIASLDKKSVLFYVKDFQPSLDDAAENLSNAKAVDLTKSLELVHHEGLAEHEHHHGEAEGEAHDEHHEGEGHGEHEGEAHDEHSHSHDDADAADPHFWLDPQRMVAAGQAMTDYLVKSDAAHADSYKANFETLKKNLEDLDSSFAKSTTTCQRRTIVTTHTAFGYLTDRYKLKQVSLSGVDPEAEPSPAVLASVKEFIKKDGTTTIFTEELVSPKTAQALASETGVATAVLNPMESAPKSGDYVTEMKANLSEITKALGCS